MNKGAKALLIILALATVAIVAAITIFRRKKHTYEVTDEAKKYLQVYQINNIEGVPNPEPYYYHTGAEYVIAYPDKAIDIVCDLDGVGRNRQFTPISTVIYSNGKKIFHKSQKHYILSETIKPK